jgi:hypothetical protein
MYVHDALAGSDPFPEGKHPALQTPGMFICRSHPARIGAGKGKFFKIDMRPIMTPQDPRAQAVEMAILLLFPGIIFNHSFDALFKPKGSVLMTDKGRVAFAFPLDEKCVTDEMIDIAANFVRTGGLQKLVPNAAKSADMILTEAGSGAAAGAVLGKIGIAAGAVIGALKGMFSFFGDQEYDPPDPIKPFYNAINRVRIQRGIHWHYSDDDRDDDCVILWFEQKGQYNIVEAAERLFRKLGQKWPGDQKPAAPKAAPAQAASAPPQPAPPLRPTPPPRRPMAPRRSAQKRGSHTGIVLLVAAALGALLIIHRRKEVE